MQVHEAMTRGVECVRPDDTLQDVAQRMKDLGVGALPVCENDRLVGIITDRDITVRATAEGEDPWTGRVHEFMTRGITYCFEDQDIIEGARLMKQNQLRRLVVLNRAKRLVGIVSLGDLAVETGDEPLTGEALEAISEPVHTRGTSGSSREASSGSRRFEAPAKGAMHPGLLLLGGFGVGAGLMYLFDPLHGRRRRALLRDAPATRLLAGTAGGALLAYGFTQRFPRGQPARHGRTRPDGTGSRKNGLAAPPEQKERPQAPGERGDPEAGT